MFSAVSPVFSLIRPKLGQSIRVHPRTVDAEEGGQRPFIGRLRAPDNVSLLVPPIRFRRWRISSRRGLFSAVVAGRFLAEPALRLFVYDAGPAIEVAATQGTGVAEYRHRGFIRPALPASGDATGS